MADDGYQPEPEIFAQLRAHAQKYLEGEELVIMRNAMRDFLGDRNIRQLVDRLAMVLTTPEKKRLFTAIGRIIPASLESEYVSLIRPLRSANAAELSEEEKERLREEGRRYLQQRKREEEAKAGRVKLQGFFGESEADQDEDEEEDEDVDDEDDDYNGGLGHFVVLGCRNRQESEAVLNEAGGVSGLWMVRKKNMLTDGSFKLKAGQRPPFAAWVLSVIMPDGKISHQLIQQAESGGPISVGSKLLEKHTRLESVLRKMKHTPASNMLQPVFQAQPWYHSTISRQEAEALLLIKPVPGHFLVRKSTRERDTFVVSLVFNARVYHNKLQRTAEGFAATCDPADIHRTLMDLVEMRRKTKGKFQCKLKSICRRVESIRRRPQAFGPAAGGAGAAGGGGGGGAAEQGHQTQWLRAGEAQAPPSDDTAC